MSTGPVLHHFITPVVEPTPGNRLPGLLGLECLETMQAIIDVGRQLLILPGAGQPIKYDYYPGSVVIPMEKSRTGQRIDQYEGLGELQPCPDKL